MVTCFRMSWGDRRQRVRSALFHSDPTTCSPMDPDSLSTSSPWPSRPAFPPRRAAGCYPKHHGPPPCQILAHMLCREHPPPTSQTPPCPECAPFSSATTPTTAGRADDLLLTSRLLTGLLKRTQNNQSPLTFAKEDASRPPPTPAANSENFSFRLSAMGSDPTRLGFIPSLRMETVASCHR